jgi:glutathione peroxidase
VLGFPCNDFGAQEPGTNEEIKEFCSTKYAVTFPLFDKLHVKGPEQHKLYGMLTGETSPYPGEIKWNFGKFLIGRDGRILKRFEPKTAPDSPEVIEAIEAALK